MSSLLERIRTATARPAGPGPVPDDLCAAADTAVVQATQRLHEAEEEQRAARADVDDRRATATQLRERATDALERGADVDDIVAAEAKADVGERVAAMAPQAADAAVRRARDARHARDQAERLAGHVHRSALAAELDPLLEQIADLADQIEQAASLHPDQASKDLVHDGPHGVALAVLQYVEQLRDHIRDDWPDQRATIHKVASRSAEALQDLR